MKMQKFAIFVKTDLKINKLKIKNIAKLGTIVFKQINVEVLHNICAAVISSMFK